MTIVLVFSGSHSTEYLDNKLIDLIISSAAQARIHFMETYKKAYAASEIQEHIDYGTNLLNRSKQATTDVQNEHNGMVLLLFYISYN